MTCETTPGRDFSNEKPRLAGGAIVISSMSRSAVLLLARLLLATLLLLAGLLLSALLLLAGLLLSALLLTTLLLLAGLLVWILIHFTILSNIALNHRSVTRP